MHRSPWQDRHLRRRVRADQLRGGSSLAAWLLARTKKQSKVAVAVVVEVELASEIAVVEVEVAVAAAVVAVEVEFASEVAVAAVEVAVAAVVAAVEVEFASEVAVAAVEVELASEVVVAAVEVAPAVAAVDGERSRLAMAGPEHSFVSFLQMKTLECIGRKRTDWVYLPSTKSLLSSPANFGYSDARCSSCCTRSSACNACTHDGNNSNHDIHNTFIST